MATHHTLAPTPANVHWGFLDAKIPPRLTIEPGDTVTIGTLSGGLADVGDTSIMQPHHREICEQLKPSPGPHILTGPIAVFPQLGIPSDEKVVAHALPKVELGLQVMERQLAHGNTFWAPSSRWRTSSFCQAPTPSG